MRWIRLIIIYRLLLGDVWRWLQVRLLLISVLQELLWINIRWLLLELLLVVVIIIMIGVGCGRILSRSALWRRQLIISVV